MGVASREYIISCIKAGFTDSQIAEAVGVTPSAVSQIVDTYNLREIALQNSKFQGIDSQWNDIEELALTQMHKTLKFLTDPMKLARVAQVANAAKRRSLAEGSQLVQNNQLVQLSLPEHIQVEVQLNAQNQVVAVEGRELLTMPSSKLLNSAELKEIGHAESQDAAENPKNIASLL